MTVKKGYAVKSSNGDLWGPKEGRWALYQTKRNAEKAADRYIGAKAVRVTLTVEEIP